MWCWLPLLLSEPQADRTETDGNLGILRGRIPGVGQTVQTVQAARYSNTGALPCPATHALNQRSATGSPGRQFIENFVCFGGIHSDLSTFTTLLKQKNLLPVADKLDTAAMAVTPC
jgi:hypothetical protein